MFSLDEFKENLEDFRKQEIEAQRLAKLKNDWYNIYAAAIVSFCKEYSDKGWGQVDEKAMEGIISKAVAIADLHQKVASATV